MESFPAESNNLPFTTFTLHNSTRVFFPSLEKRTIYTNDNFRKIQGNTIPSLISIIVLEVSHIFGLVRYSTHFLEPRIFLFCWYSNSYNSAETNEMEVSNGFYQKI